MSSTYHKYLSYSFFTLYEVLRSNTILCFIFRYGWLIQNWLYLPYTHCCMHGDVESSHVYSIISTFVHSQENLNSPATVILQIKLSSMQPNNDLLKINNIIIGSPKLVNTAVYILWYCRHKSWIGETLCINMRQLFWT